MTEPCCSMNARGAHCDSDHPCGACEATKRQVALERMVRRVLSLLALVVLGSIGVVIGKWVHL